MADLSTTPDPNNSSPEDGQPVQTDNRPRPEDGEQDVDQTPQAPGGSPE